MQRTPLACLVAGVVSWIPVGCDSGGGAGGGGAGGGTTATKGCAYEVRTNTTCTDTGTDISDWEPGCNANASSCDISDYDSGQNCYDVCCTRADFRNVHWVASCPEDTGGTDPPSGDECTTSENYCDGLVRHRCVGGQWEVEDCNAACKEDGYNGASGCTQYDCSCTLCPVRARCGEKKKALNGLSFESKYIVELLVASRHSFVARW